ncbi:hypothetical protein TWF481_007887 [Arthrobotrys musiformis]|uniref:Uncharacterized protein n=1 Tax=Arthrobotrys musiformis TaxID=47236 RepID=A0AAV9W5I4_9PEZI
MGCSGNATAGPISELFQGVSASNYNFRNADIDTSVAPDRETTPDRNVSVGPKPTNPNPPPEPDAGPINDAAELPCNINGPVY